MPANNNIAAINHGINQMGSGNSTQLRTSKMITTSLNMRSELNVNGDQRTLFCCRNAFVMPIGKLEDLLLLQTIAMLEDHISLSRAQYRARLTDRVLETVDTNVQPPANPVFITTNQHRLGSRFAPSG